MAFKSEQNFEPLPASGLLGPIQIAPRRKVIIRLYPSLGVVGRRL
jgi:hypothetical protein